MGDVIFLAVILAFFGVATLLVRACDRIIGPDPEVTDSDVEPAVDVVGLDDLGAEGARSW